MDRRVPNAERKHRLNREIMAPQVRLNGIDCPERGQPFGSRAKQFTADLAFGKTVTKLRTRLRSVSRSS